mgnify:CR=1 FL=1
MKNIKVEIVTPVFNRRELTLQWLRSLDRIDRTGLDIHIIILDAASTDGTADAVRESYPDVEIIQGSSDLWYTAGTNRAIEAAMECSPDYILACNNDSIFEASCILRMVKCAEAHSRSVIGAVLLNWESPHKVFQLAPRWELMKGGMRHWLHQTVFTIPPRPFEVELIVGNCVLYPAAAIREAGLMDEKRLIQYGDAEYTPRMRRLGWKLLIEPKARVFCLPNDPPPSFMPLPFKEKLKMLFINSGRAHSLHRRFYTNFFGAPNKFQGALAFPVFYLRYFLGRNMEGQYGLRAAERPLSETLEKAVVEPDRDVPEVLEDTERG